MAIIVNLDVMMAKRKMSLLELSEKVGIAPPNLSMLKTGRSIGLRFSTIASLCRVLKCSVYDLVEYQDDEDEAPV